MKKFLYSLMILGFALVSATAADIEKHRAEETGKHYEEYKTLAGRVYKDVLITQIDDAGIYINHADGAARIRYEHLSPEQREYFGITKEGASEVYAQEMKIRAEYEAKVEEKLKAKRELMAKEKAAQAEADRLAAAQTPTEQKIVASNVQSYVEIPTFPPLKRIDTGVIYGTRNRSRSYSTNYFGGGYYDGGYYGGGYVYPSSYGYYPCYSPVRTGCSPAHRSIFHFTIK